MPTGQCEQHYPASTFAELTLVATLFTDKSRSLLRHECLLLRGLRIKSSLKLIQASPPPATLKTTEIPLVDGHYRRLPWPRR